MKFLLVAASLRKESCNKKLIRLAAQLFSDSNIEIDLADYREFTASNYNADDEKEQGFPPEIQAFHARIKAASGLVIASPEYNFSTPGTLKNLIDWVSRLESTPWKNCPVLLLSASPSMVGGNRGLWATRIPLECCGAYVYPDMFSLASAYNAFDEQGQLKDPVVLKRLQTTVENFSTFVKRIGS